MSSYINKLVLVAVILFPINLLAQAGMEDVIYLKDGGVLRGEIIEMNVNESLKIEIAGRNVIVVKMEDIDEIKKEEIPGVQYYKKSGYINYTGLDFLPGDYSTTMRYQMVNGYQFDPFISAGFGIGFVSYNDPLNAVPVFLEVRVKLIEANIAPFFFVKGGYNFSLLPNDEIPIENHSGGFMINPGAGIQFENSNNFGWYFTAGFNADRFSYEEEEWGGRTVETQLSYKRIHFGFGLVF